ncbi:MAG: reverse transcriptase family protein [Pseudomonadota bacterium]
MADRTHKARLIAQALRSGEWRRDAVADRLARTLPPGMVDADWLATRLLYCFGGSAAPNLQVLTRYLLDEDLLQRFLADNKRHCRFVTDSPATAPPPGKLATRPLPRISTIKDLCLWLGLSDRELQWFADCRGSQHGVAESKLHHYRYGWLNKADGSLRIIEKPKARLKEIQRQILAYVLRWIPPHDSSHGFTRGRSTRSHAALHVGQPALLCLDLKDFFTTVSMARVAALYRTLGYPPAVARLLTGLCSNTVAPVLAGPNFQTLDWYSQKRLKEKHLAQGAPTSPVLANLCAWRLDFRLEGLARRLGFRYSRYADDMAFSGDARLARRASNLASQVGAIALEEGFHLNHRKTRLRTASQRQRLAGIVVNTKPNCSRQQFDRLKAILHNCAKTGPEAQNHADHPDFGAHLLGRISYVRWLNPDRGEKLLRLWRQVEW